MTRRPHLAWALTLGLAIAAISGLLAAALAVVVLRRPELEGAIGAACAYPLAALLGAVTWHPSAVGVHGRRAEAPRRCLFGALVSAVTMFALRRWLVAPVNLIAIDAGAAAAGALAGVALPLVALLMGALSALEACANVNGDGSVRGPSRPSP
jgi:hypothetical protein